MVEQFEFLTYETSVKNFTPKFNVETLYIRTYSDENLLELSRHDDNALAIYRTMLEHNYVLDGHVGRRSRFVPLDTYVPIDPSVRRFKQVLYQVEDVPEKKENPNTKSKLLVVFSGMPGSDYDSSSALHRMFYPLFPQIQRSLLKNTIVLRIADFNLSHGSFYVNTVNKPTIETDIQDLIKTMQAQYHVADEQIVLYGASKGGAGALYHASLGKYKSVVVDPIIDDSRYVRFHNDVHLQTGFREINLTPRINELMAQGEQPQKIIIGNHFVEYTWNQYQSVTPQIKVIDIDDLTVTEHPLVAANSVPELLTLLNLQLATTEFANSKYEADEN